MVGIYIALYVFDMTTIFFFFGDRLVFSLLPNLDNLLLSSCKTLVKDKLNVTGIGLIPIFPRINFKDL